MRPGIEQRLPEITFGRSPHMTFVKAGIPDGPPLNAHAFPNVSGKLLRRDSRWRVDFHRLGLAIGEVRFKLVRASGHRDHSRGHDDAMAPRRRGAISPFQECVASSHSGLLRH